MHKRIIPRDLFNEAMLLKSLGRVIILSGCNRDFSHIVSRSNPNEQFMVEYDEKNNTLRCSNIIFEIGGVLVRFQQSINARTNYPIMASIPWVRGVEEISVLTEDGEPDEDFLAVLKIVGQHVDMGKYYREHGKFCLQNHGIQDINCYRCPERYEDVYMGIGEYTSQEHLVKELREVYTLKVEEVERHPDEHIDELFGSWIKVKNVLHHPHTPTP